MAFNVHVEDPFGRIVMFRGGVDVTVIFFTLGDSIRRAVELNDFFYCYMAKNLV